MEAKAQEACNQLFAQADENNDGSITYEEVVKVSGGEDSEETRNLFK